MRKALAWTLVLTLIISAIGVLADGIQFPENLLQIADEAFMGNTAIESVTLNDGVKKIGARAFRNCSALKEITLPDSIEFIGEDAFDPDVQIYCSLDSYAYDYVRDNGLTLNLMGSYAVQDVRMEGNRLTVAVSNTLPCALRAELLDDSQTEVLYAETLNIPDGSSETREFSFDIDPLPDTFVIRATLLDGSGRVIDNPFVSMENTELHRTFEAKTPEDFEGKTVLEFNTASGTGPSDASGFAVLDDDVVTVSGSAADGGFIVTTDQPIVVGSCIYIPEANDAIKIESLSARGANTYFVTANYDDISIGDIYEYLRIDETFDVVDSMEGQNAPHPAEASNLLFSGKTYSGSRELAKYEKDFTEGAFTGKVNALISGGYSAKFDKQLFGPEYVECTVYVQAEGNLSLKMTRKFSFSKSFELFETQVPTSVPGVSVPVTLTFPVTFGAEGSMNLSTQFKMRSGLKYDTENGLDGIRETDFTWDASAEGKLNGSMGFHAGMGLAVFKKALAVEVGAEAGVEATATAKALLDTAAGESIHKCSLCFDVNGDAYIKLDGTFSFKPPLSKERKFTKSIPMNKTPPLLGLPLPHQR